MKIVFFGTPDYAVEVIEKVYKKVPPSVGNSCIVAVVTQNPKPVGREKKITYSPIDAWAHKRNIPIFYNPNDLIKEGLDADLGILAAYGEMIPEKVIKLFPKGILNIHPSLLPSYRGASPVQAVIAAGETQTGVTIITLDSEMDHGPIVSQFEEDVLKDDTTGSLRTRLFERGAGVLTELIDPYVKGKTTPRPQDHSKATYTSLVKKEHGFIPPKYLATALKGVNSKDKWGIAFIKNFSLTPTPQTLYNFIRAMDPWPMAWSLISGFTVPKRIKILKAHLENKKLVLDEVQLEGKNKVSWKEFSLGYPKAAFETE
jgi:methionyl-tRNA formyltransferase